MEADSKFSCLRWSSHFPMHRTHGQIKAELQWEAACERLRNALHAPPQLPPDVALDLAAALEVAQKSLDALGRAYAKGLVEAKNTTAEPALTEYFEKVRSVLEKIATQTPAEQASSVYIHDRGATSAAQREFEQLAALYENGFLQATDTSSPTQRELTSPTLTADGRDLLDALQNEMMWAQVVRMVATQGTTLSLGTVKSAVAAALTGGFNS